MVLHVYVVLQNTQGNRSKHIVTKHFNVTSSLLKVMKLNTYMTTSIRQSVLVFVLTLNITIIQAAVWIIFIF